MLEKFSENGDKEEAVKQGYFKTDQDFLKQVIMLILTSLFCLCYCVQCMTMTILYLSLAKINCAKICVPFGIY